MIINSSQLQVLFDTNVSENGGTRSDYYRIITQLTQGTSDNQIDLSYGNKRTIASSGSPDQIDLSAGNVYIGRSATPVSFVELVGILVINVNTTQKLTVGGSGHTVSSMFTGTNPGVIVLQAYTPDSGVTIYPSFFALHSPKNPAYPITNSSADILQIGTDGGTNIDYYLFLLGRSA